MAKPGAQTRSLAVNAAFLKDIKDDNHDLKVLMDRIGLLAQYRETAINHWPDLIQLICDLRDQLALHFSLEEAYGYFDDAIMSAPQLSVTAECLRSQHPPLFERVRDLADRALELSTDTDEPVDQFLKDFHRFRQAFKKHEEAELRLILDALDDDVGVGD